MRRSRIYCETPLSTGQRLDLDQRNSHYLLHVLRVKPGQALVLFDGSGNDYAASVTDVSRKTVSVAVEAAIENHRANTESPLQTTLAIAISKGERMDWVMQKATELGVSRIVPLISQRVDVKLNEQRMAKKLEHWRGIVIAACEQSGRARLPLLETAAKLETWLGKAEQDIGLTLSANGQPLTPLSQSLTKTPESVTVLIGPEGGLTADEINLSEQAGFIGISMGPRILRTETAPIVALSLIQNLWGDFNPA